MTSVGLRTDLTDAVNTASYIIDEHFSQDSVMSLLLTAFDVHSHSLSHSLLNLLRARESFVELVVTVVDQQHTTSRSLTYA